jgi:hypothetical protein
MTKLPLPCGYPEVFYKQDNIFQIRWHITNIQLSKYSPNLNFVIHKYYFSNGLSSLIHLTTTSTTLCSLTSGTTIMERKAQNATHQKYMMILNGLSFEVLN